MKGLEARPLSTGFTQVSLHYSADPIGLTPEVLEEHAAEMGGKESWQWLKEMELSFTAQSGQPVFEPQWLDRQRVSMHDPIKRMDIDGSGNLIERPNGRVKIFMDPHTRPAGLPDVVEGADLTFGIGIDVGAGTGASDSAIEVFCAQNKEQAAEFADNNVRPGDLGRVAVAIARYYNDALICCVQKMHGVTTIRAMRDLGYPMLWRAKQMMRTTEVSTKNIGWPHGEMTAKKILVDRWVDAIAAEDEGAILHSVELVSQHRQYVYDEMGRVTMQALKNMNPSARDQHGDCVVASCLANIAMLDLPKFRNLRYKKLKPRSYKWFRNKYERERMVGSKDGW